MHRFISCCPCLPRESAVSLSCNLSLSRFWRFFTERKIIFDAHAPSPSLFRIVVLALIVMKFSRRKKKKYLCSNVHRACAYYRTASRFYHVRILLRSSVLLPIWPHAFDHVMFEHEQVPSEPVRAESERKIPLLRFA